MSSVFAGIEGLRYEVVADADEPIEDDDRTVIRIVDYRGPDEKGPRGAGDTLIVCAGEATASVRRGELLTAEVRMNASVRDVLGERRMLARDDWTGALMHELGHALGFQGHPRSGDSILVLEHERLRRAGRRARVGEVYVDPVLSALYRLELGLPVGYRFLSAASTAWRVRIENRRVRLGGALGPARVSVGDQAAQIAWEERGGPRIRLVFPSWREQLARGRPLIAIPSPATRFRLGKR